MLKMKPDGGGRRTVEEISQEVQSLYGVDLVDGVEEVQEGGPAFRNQQWVASFLDARCAYYVHQSGTEYLQWKTAPVPKSQSRYVVFVFSMGIGYGSALPQPSGQCDLLLNSQQILSFRITNEDMTWRNDEFAFHYSVKQSRTAPLWTAMVLDGHLKEESMASFGLGFVKVPKRMLKEGEGALLKVVLRGRQSSRRWFKLDVSTWGQPLLKADLDDGLKAVCEGPSACKIGGQKIYFGDIHAHSGDGIQGANSGCGLGTVDENYQYARDVACLDIFALTEHDWQILDDLDWLRRLEKADKYNVPGRFVTLPAYEWTSARYGHRNVYFRSSAGARLFKSGPVKNKIDGENDTPAQLWQKLGAAAVKAVTVPHHPDTGFFPMDWSYMDPEFDRAVEIYSTWGNAEYYGAPHAGSSSDKHQPLSVQEALKLGHKLAFMASSDGHDGHPGDAQWSYRQPHLHHFLGSGRVAVMADELTREAVFDAIYARRCYATTGPRILLDFKLDGQPMGSEIEVKRLGATKVITASIVGTGNLREVALIKDNLRILTLCADGKCLQLQHEDTEAKMGLHWYYLRVVQQDGEMAWSSPIWVKE